MSTAKFRWGILATGRIAHKFAAGIKALPDHEVFAVGSRTAEKAQAFATEHGVARAYGSYEALARDEELDAIYIATPNNLHADTAILCLEYGRPVLCEKPLAANLVQAEAMVGCARQHEVFLMEAIWTRFLPVMAVVRGWLDEGRIGDLRRVRAGELESPAMPLDESLMLAATMDRLRAEWGVRYPFDSV